jgi:hypothetical protein
MNRSLLRTKSKHRAPRRGLSAVALILSMSAILCLVALGIDIGLLVQRHQQLKTASEAAALASALELFGPRLIFDEGNRVRLARQAALNFAASNIVSERPLKLDANQKNSAAGDVVLGRIDPPELPSRFIPQQGDQWVNAIVVRTRHSQTGRFSPALQLSQMLGVPSSNLFTESMAAVDHRIVGFRPVGCSNVPLLPLLIQIRHWSAASGNAADDPHGAGESSNSASLSDLFTVDSRNGVVANGPDGIPEFQIVVGGGQSSDSDIQSPPGEGSSQAANVPSRGAMPAWIWASNFGSSKSNDDTVTIAKHPGNPGAHVLALEGLNALELAATGGQIVLGNQILCQANGLPSENAGGLATLQAALNQIAGQPRLLALGDVGVPSDDARGELVTGVVQNFAAGAVIEAQSTGASLIILVQPVVFNSCTAIVRSGIEPNPWIGKIVLVH